MISRKILVLGIGLAAAAGAGAFVAGSGRSAGPPDPNEATVRQATESPQEVQRHWTPERIRQAQENTRRMRGPLD